MRCTPWLRGGANKLIRTHISETLPQNTHKVWLFAEIVILGDWMRRYSIVHVQTFTSCCVSGPCDRRLANVGLSGPSHFERAWNKPTRVDNISVTMSVNTVLPQAQWHCRKRSGFWQRPTHIAWPSGSRRANIHYNNRSICPRWCYVVVQLSPSSYLFYTEQNKSRVGNFCFWTLHALYCTYYINTCTWFTCG